MKFRLSKSELEKLYVTDNLSTEEIAQKIGVSRITVRNHLLQLGVPIKQKNGRFGEDFYVNDRFFRVWSSDMAYVLGYIASDGCVSRTKYSFSVKSIDYDQLIHVQSVLQTNYGISACKNSNCYILVVYSKKMVMDLIELGITPRKSLTIRMPNIPSQYFWDFLRGMVDGDGHVRPVKDSTRQISFQITGCRLLLSELLSELQKRTGCPEYVINAQGRAGCISISGKYAYECLKKMYNNDRYGLSRKKFMAMRLVLNYERSIVCQKCGKDVPFAYVTRKYCNKCSDEINKQKWIDYGKRWHNK